MTARLVLATKNAGKIRELRDLLRDVDGVDILTSADAPFSDVEETGRTFLENALLKARGVSRELALPVLAEDAGLEVAALGGAPGVRSARFSGEPVDYARNNALLLEKLRGERDRSARFVATAVLFFPSGRFFVAVGVLRGRILEECRGTGGFGYDPLFTPDGEARTLAEMSSEDKNRISHRGGAAARVVRLLRCLADAGDL